MSSSRPLIALTLGDIAGVGSEIVAKVLADPDVQRLCRPAVFGPLSPLNNGLRDFAPGVKAERIGDAAALADWDFDRAVPIVDDLSVKAPPCRAVKGQVSAEAGR